MFKASENKGVDMNWRAFEYDTFYPYVLYIYMLRPIHEIAQFMNWAPLMPSSWNVQ